MLQLGASARAFLDGTAVSGAGFLAQRMSRVQDAAALLSRFKVGE